MASEALDVADGGAGVKGEVGVWRSEVGKNSAQVSTPPVPVGRRLSSPDGFSVSRLPVRVASNRRAELA